MAIPMDVTSLSSADFYRSFHDSADIMSKIDNNREMFEDDSTNRYRAWLIVAYCALLTIGVIGNVWVASVISCVLRASSKRTFGVLGSIHGGNEAPRAIQIYILTLCCSDLIVLAFLLFLIADLIYGHWILPASTSLCRLYLCTESLNKFCGPFLLVALSGYCYVSVCKRHWKQIPLSSNAICAGVIAVCFALVLLLITPVFIYGDVQFLIVHNATDTIYSVTPKCALQPPEAVLTAFTIYSFLFGYLLPAFLYVFFYSSILVCAYRQVQTRVRRRSQTRKTEPAVEGAATPPNKRTSTVVITGGNRGGSRRGRRSYLSRVVKTSLGLVVFYVFCWSPYYIMCLYQYLTPHHSMHESNIGVVLGYLIHMLPYINCTGYPIMYTVLNKTIKDAYRQQAAKRSTRKDHSNHLLLLERTVNEKTMVVGDIAKAPSCLIELSVAISTSYVSNNSQLQIPRDSKGQSLI